MSSEPGPEPSPLRVVVSNRQSMPVDEIGLGALAERTLLAEGTARGELSVSFVTDDEMTDLHVRFLHESGPTDVLAFPLHEDGLLGDVVVCPSEAGRTNPDLASELRLLVVHGVLHVLGYDHQDAEERRAMWERQERYSGIRAS